jgi:hypothetical protein
VQHSATILATAILSWERFFVSSMIFSFSWFHSPAYRTNTILPQIAANLKGLSHEIDLAFDDMYG